MSDKAETQVQIDIKNLRFYSAMAHDFKWQTDVIHYGVISQTLSEIADRLAESQRTQASSELLGQLDVVMAYLEEDAPKTAYCIVKIIKARLESDTAVKSA